MFIRTAFAALVTVGITAAALTAAPAAVAAPDVTPPKIESFTFTPERIDLSTGAKAVTVTVRITDETGLDRSEPVMIINSDDTTQTQGFGVMARASGTAQDGVYTRTVTMPDNVAPGDWSVTMYPLSDTLGNSSSAFVDAAKKLNVRYGDAPPAAPRVVTATAGDRSATVSWTAPVSDQPITSYTVTSDPAAATQTVGASATSVELTGLTNGTAYAFSVVATSAAGTSAAAISARVTPSGLPATPTDVAAQPRDGAAYLTWAPPADNGGTALTAYKVTVMPGDRIVTVPAPSTGTTISGLTNGAAYTFTVAAANARGESPASSPTTEVIPAGAPLRMTPPAATVKKTTITLRWNPAEPNGSPISNYVVSWKGHSKTVSAGVTSLVLRKMKPGRYSFTIRARNDAGTSPASPPRSVRVR